MAKKEKAAAVDGEEEPKKKKPIKLILIVVVALVGVKFFVLKDAPPTPEQVKAAAKKVQEELYNTCAEANGLPTLADLVDGGKDPSASSTDKPKKSETSTTAKQHAGAARQVVVHYQLIADAATVPEMGPIVPNDASVTVNLQDGNFLKVGLAIQLPLGGDPKLAKEEGMLAEATDLALKALVPNNIKDLYPQSKRDEIQKALSFDTCRDTKGKILKILFTEFVFQNAQ